jgi:hypothetical protein
MSTASATHERQSFWGRQFAPQITSAQIGFDAAFGIGLPLICLWNDPIVFRSGGFGRPLLGPYTTVAAVAIGLGLISLTAWLSIRRPPALFAGLMCGSAIFAALLGSVLLPFSIIGLVFVIGILGFSPFATAFVFWRNAVRAYRKARESGARTHRLALATTGLLITCGGPWAVHVYVTHEVSQAIEMALSADPTKAVPGITVLKWFWWSADFDRLVFAYEAEKDTKRRERLAAFYKELTGEEIEHRLAILRD